MSGVEIVGLAASVLQIADVGARLSVQIFNFSRKIMNANKTIDRLSQEIALTGATLNQLGEALKQDDSIKLCSQEAIDTATKLVEDTNKVFNELEKLVDNGKLKSTNKLKGVIGWRQKLKFPFIEPQIEQVQANLERLKSSLNVILNVLIFAEQLRSKAALPILEEQRDLLRVLDGERQENEKRYENLCKAICAISVKDTVAQPNDATVSLSKASTIIGSDTPSLKSISTSTFGESEEVLVPVLELPPALELYREMIHNHSNLVQCLLTEIASTQHKVDYGIRDRMQKGVLDIHWKEWSTQRQQFPGDHFKQILSSHPTVARHWAHQTVSEMLTCGSEKEASTDGKHEAQTGKATDPTRHVEGSHESASSAPCHYDFTMDSGFNLDYSTLEDADVLENFDFDGFLNADADDEAWLEHRINRDLGLDLDTNVTRGSERDNSLSTNVIDVAEPDVKSTEANKSAVSSTDMHRFYPEVTWENVKPQIIQYYIDGNLNLSQVMEKMRQESNFHATEKMYKMYIKKWGLTKFITGPDRMQMLFDKDTTSRQPSTLPDEPEEIFAKRSLKRKRVREQPILEFDEVDKLILRFSTIHAEELGQAKVVQTTTGVKTQT